MNTGYLSETRRSNLWQDQILKLFLKMMFKQFGLLYVITDVKNYIWRTDLSKTEIISDKQFIEYTKNGYATTFTITLLNHTSDGSLTWKIAI